MLICSSKGPLRPIFIPPLISYSWMSYALIVWPKQTDVFSQCFRFISQFKDFFVCVTLARPIILKKREGGGGWTRTPTLGKALVEGCCVGIFLGWFVSPVVGWRGFHLHHEYKKHSREIDESPL